MSENRHRRVFTQDWDAKPCRERQRKVWSRLVDDLFVALDVDKAEWLEDVEKEDSSLKFLAMGIGERMYIIANPLHDTRRILARMDVTCYNSRE